MNGPGEQHNDAPGGMKSAPGSDGSLSDRPGTPGFPQGSVDTVSGSATKTPDRDSVGFETGMS